MAKRRDWRKYRQPVKYEYADSWNYVRERLADPSLCAKGQYSTIADGKRAWIRAKGLRIILCCPRGSRMETVGGKRVGCFRGGKRVRSPMAQAVLHDVRKFRFRHAKIWRELMRQPADPETGIRTLWMRAEVPVRRVAVAGMEEALEGIFGG